jgi:hypothetical protein
MIAAPFGRPAASIIASDRSGVASNQLSRLGPFSV